MNVEEEHLDILQNIEFAIASVFREHPETLDYDVDTTLNALIRFYRGQQRGGEPALPELSEIRQEIFNRVHTMCEFRLGRQSLDIGGEINAVQSVDLAVIDACLKRIRKSVQIWTKRGGRQGYLTFVEGFVP